MAVFLELTFMHRYYFFDLIDFAILLFGKSAFFSNNAPLTQYATLWCTYVQARTVGYSIILIYYDFRPHQCNRALKGSEIVSKSWDFESFDHKKICMS